MVHRNSLLTGLYFLIIGCLGVFTWLVVFQAGQGGLFSEFEYGVDYVFWLVRGPGGSLSLIQHFLSSGLLLVLGLSAGALVRRHFHRTASTESFFISAYFLLMGLDFLRLFVPLFVEWNLSFFYSLTLSRIIYSLRFLELLILLSMSLYALGFEYQKANHIMMGGFLLAVALGIAWPMDSLALSSTLLYPMAEEAAALFVHGAVILLTVFALGVAPAAGGASGGDGRRWKEAGIMVLLVLGREATYFPSFFYPGFTALLLGAALMVRAKKKSLD